MVRCGEPADAAFKGGIAGRGGEVDVEDCVGVKDGQGFEVESVRGEQEGDGMGRLGVGR